LESDYVEMARLKGLPERLVLRRHALPNALGPTFQVIAINLAYLAGGVIVVEYIFNYAGIGGALRDAVANRDIPVVQALAMAIAIVGPRIAPHGGKDFVGTPNSLKVPGALFGTDHIGQDVWSRFLHGGLTILVLAAAATLLGLVLGIAVGLVAAYSRNVLDDILMRAMDVILAFPQIMLALVAIATVGPNPVTIILAVGLTTMPR